MKKFILKLLLYLGLVLLVFAVCLVSVNQILKQKGSFKLAPNTKYIIFGQSHSMCAYNDSLITDFQNISNSGEAYFYSLPKLKQIIKQNTEIECVFIEFTNSQIVKSIEHWMWDYKYLSYHYCIYSPFISFKDKLYLFRKTPADYLKVIPVEIKFNATKIISGNYDFKQNWGHTGVNGNLKVYLDSLENGVEVVDMVEIDNNISEDHLKYLDEMIEYLKSKNINVILVRSPIHKDYSKYFVNEEQFQKILSERYSEIKFVDFVDFPLDDSCYKDYRHLNKKGSAIFSKYFNDYLNDSIIK